jgi:hypothetical protein
MAIDLLPERIRESYEVHEWRHACAVLHADFPEEWDDLLFALDSFRLLKSEVVARGGGRSRISARIDGYFHMRGWKEQRFDTEFRVNGNVVASHGHKIDNYKNGIACDVEWNNKTEFYDRDLNNFARLHGVGAIAVGVIITRASHLDDVFRELGTAPDGKAYREKYGQSTTHLDRLIPKVNGGAAGGCPVLVFGITRTLWIDDIATPQLFVRHPVAPQFER